MPTAGVIDVGAGSSRLFLFRQRMGAEDLLITYVEGVEGPAMPGAELIFSAEPPDFHGGDVYAFAAPIAPGRTEEWLSFARELSGARREELLEQRARLGLKETIFLQRGPHADLVIPVIEGDRPWEEDHRIAASEEPFDQWFITRLAELHNLDFSQPPPPRNELLYRWDRGN